MFSSDSLVNQTFLLTQTSKRSPCPQRFNWLTPLSMTFPKYLKTLNFLIRAPLRGWPIIPICQGLRDMLGHGHPMLKPRQSQQSPSIVVLSSGARWKSGFTPVPYRISFFSPPHWRGSGTQPLFCGDTHHLPQHENPSLKSCEAVMGVPEGPRQGGVSCHQVARPLSPQGPSSFVPVLPSLSASFWRSALLTLRCKKLPSATCPPSTSSKTF